MKKVSPLLELDPGRLELLRRKLGLTVQEKFLVHGGRLVGHEFFAPWKSSARRSPIASQVSRLQAFFDLRPGSNGSRRGRSGIPSTAPHRGRVPGGLLQYSCAAVARPFTSATFSAISASNAAFNPAIHLS